MTDNNKSAATPVRTQPQRAKATTPKLGLPRIAPKGTKLPPLRAPSKKFPYRTLKEMLWAWRWGMTRLAIAIVILIMVTGRARPAWESLAEEQYRGAAVSKARVLLRSAQLAASDELWNFATHDEAERHLLSSGNLDAIVAQSRFAVEAVEIKDVSLDANGIIDRFDCVIDNDYRRYRIIIDVKEDTAKPELLEKLERPDPKEKN